MESRRAGGVGERVNKDARLAFHFAPASDESLRGSSESRLERKDDSPVQLTLGHLDDQSNHPCSPCRDSSGATDRPALVLTPRGRFDIDSAKMESASFPDCIKTQDDLDLLLSRPSAQLLESVRNFKSPLVIIGAGGKLGPHIGAHGPTRGRRGRMRRGNHCRQPVQRHRSGPRLAGRARRNDSQLRPPARGFLRQLPDSENVIYLAGQKFGAAKSPSATWAVNIVASSRVAERYPRARLVALSTANVYPFSEVSKGGSVESDPLTPLGEYANSAVGRERILEFFSLRDGIPLAMLRLCYAVELRYGVLLDIAQKVHGGRPIDLANGYFNCIWQGDANDLILRSLSGRKPAHRVESLPAGNLPGARRCRAIWKTARAPAPIHRQRKSKRAPVQLSSHVRPTGGTPHAAASNAALDRRWVRRDGCTWGKPTGFEVRDGKY